VSNDTFVDTISAEEPRAKRLVFENLNVDDRYLE